MFKFDEQQACLQQNQRKDSASSEVAALLCISGRTSRISSVGSQGSAVSRLSAVSGISRSPSPHKMLLETSFCGPKPLDSLATSCIANNSDQPISDILEQVLLGRKHDPTQVVIAEGIHIDVTASPPKKIPPLNESKTVSNGSVTDRRKPIEHVSRSGHSSSATASHSKSGIAKAKNSSTGSGVLKQSMSKPIVGVTSSGVQYIRIKLKPDHLYGDKVLGDNERVVDEIPDSIKKPITLSLGQETPKKAAPHFSQLVQSDDTISKCPIDPKLTPNASPKPARHLLREVASRSPSPATVNVSRKSSFCSLFKLKDAIASPESPTLANSSGQRKKSGISVLLSDSPRDRSRSKSRERDPKSQNTTPNKQKSVLAIFKPKRSGSKSKSSSPVDPEAMSALDGVEFKFSTSPKEVCSGPPARPGTQKLRYYDQPADGKSIFIPLHTPPDELENSLCTVSVIAERRQQQSVASATVAIELKQLPLAAIAKPASSTIATTSTTNVYTGQKTTAIPKPSKTDKVYRIENADGSIRIPLKSPSSGELPADTDTMWSLEVQRNSSLESQETVISNQTFSSDNFSKPRKSSIPSLPVTSAEETSQHQTAPVIQTQNKTPVESLPSNGITPNQPPLSTTGWRLQEPTASTCTPSSVIAPSAPPTTPASITHEKKRILFSTRIGSGSQEQIFATQLSLSKTESLSSQLSEQILDSPANEKDLLQRIDTNSSNVRRQDDVQSVIDTVTNSNQPRSVDNSLDRQSIGRQPDELPLATTTISIRQPISIDEPIKRTKPKSNRDTDYSTDNSMQSNRHSRYIENIDEIMKTQRQLDLERRETIRNSIKDESLIAELSSEEKSIDVVVVAQNRKPEPILQIPGPPPLLSDEPHCSSESERGSEMQMASSVSQQMHLTRQIGAVEEESTGLVAQESFDDDLPYVPTTLPEERSLGISLVPIKERSFMDVKTIPVDRPRSTTPMNPSCLEEYCGTTANAPAIDDGEITPVRCEKLKISLPRKDSKEKLLKNKSPRRISNASGKSWFEFAEQGIGGVPTISSPSTISGDRRNSNDDEPPPPLPPRKPQTVSQWINFENIPEKRKPPKRITTLPNKDTSMTDGRNAQSHHVQYNYVNPDECQCECHEIERSTTKDSSSSDCGGHQSRKSGGTSSGSSSTTVTSGSQSERKHDDCSKTTKSK